MQYVILVMVGILELGDQERSVRICTADVIFAEGCGQLPGGQPFMRVTMGASKGQWVHFSSGFSKHFIILRESLK